MKVKSQSLQKFAPSHRGSKSHIGLILTAFSFGTVFGIHLSLNFSSFLVNPLTKYDIDPPQQQPPTSHKNPGYATAQLRNSPQLKARTFENWPAIAHEAPGHPLVAKGDSFYDHARELYFGGNTPLIDEFLEVYKNRPDPVNLCGIRINHAMALFLAVKQLNPTLVVESGVNAGVSTYFIRKASPTTKIFAVDPEEKPICDQGVRWIDQTESSHLTTYYTGKNFIDLMDMDWKGMAERKEFDPETTLVFLDDHLHAYNRIIGVMKHGIRHILVEDNYKDKEGATPNDKKSTPKQMMGPNNHWKRKGDWLFEKLAKYSEFPPLVPAIMGKEQETFIRKMGFMHHEQDNTDIVPPMLRPDLDTTDNDLYKHIATTLGFDPALRDKKDYMQVMNYNQFCYLQVLPEMASSAATAPNY